jgi:hypothetical protein
MPIVLCVHGWEEEAGGDWCARRRDWPTERRSAWIRARSAWSAGEPRRQRPRKQVSIPQPGGHVLAGLREANGAKLTAKVAKIASSPATSEAMEACWMRR